MLQGQDIIYLAGHDFGTSDVRVSTDHIAHQLSRHNRILYVESVGLRSPKLNTKDLSRIRRKLGRFLTPPRQVKEGFWVLTPFAVPLHGFPLARRINQFLLTAQIRWARRKLKLRKPILFVFLPPMGGVVGKLGESVSVYYCTDEHSAFPGVDGNAIRQAETELLQKVTLGFATSTEILKNKLRINANFHFSPHAVDFDNFARAQDASVDIPADVAHLRQPIVGYFGAVERWFDLKVVEAMARARPAWTFVFIGRVSIDVGVLKTLPNVLFLGQRPFADLPRYGKAFAATIIPFIIDGLTVSVSPIKLKEYLAMGKPVISTPMPAVVEVAKENSHVRVAADAETFLAELDRALAQDSQELARARQESVRSDTWEARANAIGSIIAENLNHARA